MRCQCTPCCSLPYPSPLISSTPAARPQITTPEMSVDNRKPYVDEGGAVHWPMLLFYPEGMQQDVVEDACEEDTFAQHLDVVGHKGSAGLLGLLSRHLAGIHCC